MNREESAIISAHTGILCGPFDAMHEYIEKIMDRPVFTHELASKDLWGKIKEKSKDDFISLVSSIT